jgi:NAD(P) transhydrogenase subunit alpha
MRLIVPKEITPGEARVALVPETVAKLTKGGFEVVVETGAGLAAYQTDEAYRAAGATIAPDAAAAYGGGGLILKVREPMMHPSGRHEADLMAEGSQLIAYLGRNAESDAVKRLKARKVTAFSMEMVPRTSRAQKMDALSSMATVAGYQAMLMAARELPKFFPLLMTAAGTIAPARVFVLGAGVAGLQAIATARRLGAVVEAFDVRPAVKEEVQSLGANFVGLELLSAEAQDAGGYAKELSADQHTKELELIKSRLAKTDVVVSTAAIPGKKAPTLLTREMVEVMQPGSVIVDLAAETGGNCELTRAGETVVHKNVRILGPINMSSTLPAHASQMYSRNVHALVQLMTTKEAQLKLDWNDDIIRDSCITGAPQAAEPVAAGRTA